MGKQTKDVCAKCGSPDIMPRKTPKYGKICYPCNHKKKKAWAEVNPQYQTDWMRKKMTGCTPEQYQKLFEKQNGCCAICNQHQTEFKKALSADHCHSTGKIRGLLCGSCNTSLGGYKDDIALLVSAIEYLNSHKL